MSLTDFKAKMNKSKINKYKINNNNKTNTKHEFNVKYERYKQDISKDRKLCPTSPWSPCLKLRHVDCLAFKRLQITWSFVKIIRI
jgi:site-specific DNA-adenine methylase